MVSTQPGLDVLRTSWQLDSMTARIDTASYTTFIPTGYYTAIMKEVMDSSIGYFFDTDLNSYVLNCEQRAIMKNLYIRLDSSSDDNNWISLQPIDYMKEIDTTDTC